MAKRKDIRLSLTDPSGTIVKVKEACALVRAWVEQRNETSESQITFKEAYSDAAKALKELGIETAKPTPKRKNRMITARLASLEESEAVFLELALANYFLKGSTAS